jgi:predicted O-linked N-acetylglucosamine transferase (SPINDLY family)
MNTAMQAIGCGLPIITREGQFQRTKHVSAILKTIEAEELIAQTEEEYIDLVEKFFFDQEFQNAIKLKIKNKENYLYRNKSAIRELEDFFINVGGY